MSSCETKSSLLIIVCESERLVFERDFPLKRFKLKRALSDFLLVALFPDDIQGTILRRLIKYFPSVVPLVSVEGFDVAKRFSASLPCCVAQQLLRTWANGWTTIFLMHENELCTCLFGCAENDTLQHCLFCIVLCSVVDCALGSSAPVCLLSRLALSSPSILSACRLYVVCSCYHTVKASHCSRFRALCVAGDVSAI